MSDHRYFRIDPEICFNCEKPPEACDVCDPLSPEKEYEPGSAGARTGKPGRPPSTDLSDPKKVQSRKATKRWRDKNGEYFKLQSREYRRKKKLERSQA